MSTVSDKAKDTVDLTQSVEQKVDSAAQSAHTSLPRPSSTDKRRERSADRSPPRRAAALPSPSPPRSSRHRARSRSRSPDRHRSRRDSHSPARSSRDSHKQRRSRSPRVHRHKPRSRSSRSRSPVHSPSRSISPSRHSHSPSPSRSPSYSRSRSRSRSPERRRHKKHKKHKHKKRSHSKRSRTRSASPLPLPPPVNLTPLTASATASWGKYGVLSQTDMYNKQAEFHAWLLEVKKTHREALNRREEKEAWLEYMEDYNTATMADDKYYDIEAWMRRQREARAAVGGAREEEKDSALTDEERVRLDRRRREDEGRKRVEDLRLHEMKRALERAKEQGGGEWNNVQKRNEVTAKPTFESIAKQRELEKREAEQKMKRKWK